MALGSANPLLLASAASGGDSDPVTRSLRLDGGESLSRTFSSTGDSKKFTFACWVKRTELGGNQRIFQASNSNNDDFLRFNNDNTLGYWIYQNGSHNHQGNTTAVFRDVSAWMHVCYVVDTAQATAANRVKIFVNGVSHTLSVYPDQNRDCSVMNTAALHYIGRYGNSASEYANLYIADAFFLDGEAVEPVGNFIESNDYGGYKPKEYTGSFGTNGFHLEFEDYDDHSLIGLDSSLGGAINWDTSKYRSGYGSPSWSESNTQFDGASSNVQHTMSNFAGSGKYYAEFEFTSGSYSGSSVSGVGPVPESWWTGSTLNSYMYSGTDDARKGCAIIAEEKIKSPTGSDIDCSNTGSEPHFTVGTDRIGIEVDGTANTAVFYRVNSSEKVEIASLNNDDDGIDFGGKVAWGCTIHDANHSIRGYFTSASWLQSPSSGFAAMPSGNHFDPTNLSSHDVMLDTPTKNYATMNPVSDVVVSGSNTFSEGNLTADSSHTKNKIVSTIAVSSGKWYAEARFDDNGYQMVGIGRVDCLEDTSTYIGGNGAFGYMLYKPHGDVYHNASGTSIWGALSTGDVIQIALDLDNNKVWWGKNGTWNGTVGSSGETSISAGEYYFAQSYRDKCTWNFGQDNTFRGQETGTPDNDEFLYEIPEGFKSLNSSNLDAPSVTPSEHFNTVLYNGTYDGYLGVGTDSQSITGVGFSPDIVWIKDRDGQSDNLGNAFSGHYWFDAVLGSGSPVNIDAGQGISGSLNSGANGVDSFDSDGFSVDSADETNYSADTDSDDEPDTPERYVAWCWKLGSTKTSGSSSWSGSGQNPEYEQYNSDAGISIIDYYDGDGNGTSIEFNHSLGAAPEFAMALDYEGYHGANYAWHKDLSSGNYLDLTSTGSQTSDSTYFPSSPATNTTFEMGVSLVDGIQSHVALFRSVEGFSKFGSYEGVGSNGVFVYTGHRPKMIWIKNKTGTGNWFIFDAVRDTYNEAVNYLRPNSYGTETTNSGYKLDILSNGFRINVESSHMNNSSYEYIFCSFAEQPFAAPSNAR